MHLVPVGQLARDDVVKGSNGFLHIHSIKSHHEDWGARSLS